MAGRCMGAMHWPCDHHEKHSSAAKLGWLRRRGVQLFRRSPSDDEAFSFLGIKRAHKDASHKGLVRFQQNGKWFELPEAAFKTVVRGAKEEIRQGRIESREGDRALNRERRQMHADVVKFIRDNGGIRPERIPSGSSAKRPPGYEEWQGLPPQVRRNPKNAYDKRGSTLDEMAQEVGAVFGLGIQSGDDLRRYLEEEKLHRRERRHRLKHGGSGARRTAA